MLDDDSDNREGARHDEEGRNATDLLIWSARSHRLRRALASDEESALVDAANEVLGDLQEIVEELQESVSKSDILIGRRREITARFRRMIKRESEDQDGEIRPSKRSKL